MKNLNERIKAYRNQLHLSQEYVAKHIGVNRATFSQVELGNRKVSAEELAKLATLFGISSDALLYGQEASQPTALFARTFDSLDETDQEEIMNLMRFKQMMKTQRVK